MGNKEIVRNALEKFWPRDNAHRDTIPQSLTALDNLTDTQELIEWLEGQKEKYQPLLDFPDLEDDNSNFTEWNDNMALRMSTANKNNKSITHNTAIDAVINKLKGS